MPRIGVLTSGGDAPGMNAAIRAVTRTALDPGWDVLGIHRGYQGLLDQEASYLGARNVGGIIQQGGTVLGSARCQEFRTVDGQRRALQALEQFRIDGLVVIGGEGSQAGSLALHRLGVPLAGIPATIDNDVPGIDIALGVDTALNIALETIDRLKVTASSHHRAFLVEVMGRHHGYLALMSALAGGAEAVLLPGTDVDPEKLAARLRLAYEHGKAHAIVVVAEGTSLNASELVEYLPSTNRARGSSCAGRSSVTCNRVERRALSIGYSEHAWARVPSSSSSDMSRGDW